MGGLAGALVHKEFVSAKGSNVFSLPMSDEVRFRLLLRLLHDLIGHVDGLKALADEVGFASGILYIDDFASVSTGDIVTDFHFTLRIKGACQTLLITDDIPMMAQFIAGYLIRRHELDPDLGVLL